MSERAQLVIVGGGQAGLATAYVAEQAGLEPIVLEAGPETVGSWPRYYDSLTLFSPARYSELPGRAFGGDPERYPTRDELIAYLRSYAAELDADIRCEQRVESVTRADGGGLTLTTERGQELTSKLVIAATGGFGTPYRPPLPGLAAFGGVATRAPLKFLAQRPLGRDIHWWLQRTGLDTAPFGHRLFGGATMVLDDGRYRAAIDAGKPDARRLFTRADSAGVVWSDGTPERIDAIVLATGYRANAGYLAGIGAVDAHGAPLHRGGVSTTVPGLGFVGLSFQRSFASATVRGVGRDAAYVLNQLQQQRAITRLSQPRPPSLHRLRSI